MIAISPKLSLPVKGLFRRVTNGVYIMQFYTSIAANSVTKFSGTELHTSEFALPSRRQTIVEKFSFGVLSFDEDMITGDDLKKLSTEDCTKMVHEGFLMDPGRVPELYYNETLKVQLQAVLEPKGFTVLSLSCGTKDVLPYNPYWRSTLDLAVLKDSDNSRLLASSQVDTPPPNDDEVDDGMDLSEDEDESENKMLCVELKKFKESRAQMYAEAWNLAINKLVDKCTTRKEMICSVVTVFCILSCEKCRKGHLSAIRFDVKKCSCELLEEDKDRPIHECFNIALSLFD